jgi:hypothetical protein
LDNPQITHLTLDVLKPHQPTLPEFGSFLREVEGVKKVDISVVEVDKETESLKVIIKGNNLDYEYIRTNIERKNSVIHSVDHVIVE